VDFLVDEALKPKRLALLVGIDTFPDVRWPDLKHARKDAQILAEMLRDSKRGYFDHVSVLSDEAGTSLPELTGALDDLARRNTSPRDTVVVYFSTHGTLAYGPDGELSRYLVTTDTDQMHIRDTALRVRDLLDRFDRLPSQRKVLILASCHSGAGKSALPVPVATELKGIKGAFFVRPLEETSQAAMVLSACAWGETAREDDELEHDIYTYFLLEALAGKDEDGDGAVTATEAHAYAMAQTYYFSHGRQRPQVESTVLGTDPIVLTGERVIAPDPIVYTFLSRFEGMQVRVDGRDKGTLPARLVLTPGSHRLVVTSGPESPPVLDRVVRLEVGDQVSIEELIEREEKHWFVTARGGYQWFLDSKTRNTLVAPTPLFGITVARKDFPLDNLETALDLTLGGGNQNLEVGGLATSQSLLEVSYGIQVSYVFSWESLSILVGPRLSGLHILRSELGRGNKEQHGFNVSPGLAAQIRLNLVSSLTLNVCARLHFFSVDTKDEDLDLTYIDLFGGLGWSF
jgi:hypothetical protein